MSDTKATAQKKANNNRKFLIAFFALLLLIIGAIWYAKQQGWLFKEAKVRVATETSALRQIVETVSASGKIYPVIEVGLAPDASGEVISLTVEEGDSVRKGQLIARINPDIYESAVEQASAGVNASKSNEATSSARIRQGEAAIAQLQVQISNAKRSLDRNRQLFKDEVISKAELEAIETTAAQLEAQLQGSQADLTALRQGVEGASYNTQSTQASLKQARDNLRKTNVYAPISGIVSKLNVKQGERVVGTSQFSGTEMLRIADFSAMEARVDVSENDIVRVSLGDTALVEIDAYPDRKFTGIVTQMANSAGSGTSAVAAATNQITNFTVKVRLLPSSYTDLLQKNKLPFRPGMSCSADIQTETVRQALAVPIQAVTTREDSLQIINRAIKQAANSDNDDDTKAAAQEVVFVLNPTDQRVRLQKVKTGLQDESYIQITEGLKAGDEVVAAPYSVITKELKDSLVVEKVSKQALYKKEE